MHNVHLGRTRKFDVEAAKQKALKIKTEALGIEMEYPIGVSYQVLLEGIVPSRVEQYRSLLGGRYWLAYDPKAVHDEMQDLEAHILGAISLIRINSSLEVSVISRDLDLAELGVPVAFVSEACNKHPLEN